MRGPDDRALIDLRGLPLPDGDRDAPARFLARWDSVLIAYDVRDRLIAEPHRPAVIKKNGDFLPTFLVDGMVAGLWTVETTRGGDADADPLREGHGQGPRRPRDGGGGARQVRGARVDAALDQVGRHPLTR